MGWWTLILCLVAVVPHQAQGTADVAFIVGSIRPHNRLPTARYATDAVTVCKEELLSLVQNAPSGRATPKRMTGKILDIVRQLERKCPTPDDEILPRLTGSWELLWTAQDPKSPETKRAFSWINPLENQSYSNNPEGRANPF